MYIIIVKRRLRELIDETTTQRALAEAVGMEAASVNRIVNGKTADVRLTTALRIAQFLDCPVEEIFELNEEAAA